MDEKRLFSEAVKRVEFHIRCAEDYISTHFNDGISHVRKADGVMQFVNRLHETGYITISEDQRVTWNNLESKLIEIEANR
jgi:hypothetical protein